MNKNGNNPYFICHWAESMPGIDTKESIETLENAIIATEDIVHIYEFMFLMADMGIENFDIERFEDIIIASKNPKLMYYILDYVPGVNEKKLLKALCDTKCEKYLLLASANHIIPQEVLIEAHRHNFVPEALKVQLKRGGKYTTQWNVISSKNPYLINEFAEYYGHDEDINFDALQNAMINTGDILHIYEFACSVPGADKEKIVDIIIQRKMVKYMYYCYEYLEGADKEKLKEAIKESGNQKYIDKMQNVLH